MDKAQDSIHQDAAPIFVIIERREGDNRRLTFEPLGWDTGKFGVPLGPDDKLLGFYRASNAGVYLTWRPGPDGRPEILSVGKLEF
jgi:hypothetical protein